MLKRISGRILNASGAPGFIRSSACHDRLGVPVEIRVGELFTTIAVQNVRLLFHRISGRLDGIVVEATDCHEADVGPLVAVGAERDAP